MEVFNEKLTTLSTVQSQSKENPPQEVIKNKCPISLAAILRYTWGTTMSLSTQKQQQELSLKYKTLFDSFIENDNNKIPMDTNAKSFLSEVSFVISSIQRSYGFEREVFIDNIESATQLWNHQISYYLNLARNDILEEGPSKSPSNMRKRTAFNNTFNKLISFVGGGGAGISFFLSDLFPKSQSIEDMQSTLSQLNSKISTIENSNSQAQLNELLNNLDGKLNSLSSWWSNDILIYLTIFLVTGAIGYALYTLLANRYAYKKIQKIDLEKNKAFQDFWENQMKPDLVELFVNLTRELRKILHRYYNITDDGSLPAGGDEELRKYIANEILPDDKCYNYKSSII